MVKNKNPEFTSFSDLRDSLKAGAKKGLVVAAAHDAHTLEAVFAAANEFDISYSLVGKRSEILRISSEMGYNPPVECIVDGEDGADCAREAVRLIREGRGHVLMKGLMETGVLLRAVVNAETGIRAGGVMTHLAMLEVPGYHKVITITDGGMLTNPTLEQKVEIVRSVVDFYGRLGYKKPKIAALCASESVSEKIPETVDAAKLQVMCRNGELGDCILEGPLSFDLAVSKEAAAVKGVKSEVAGDADVLLVPNITTGNVLSKGLIYWAGAKMAGCVCGAKAPIVVVSRNATAEEKLLSVMLCLRAGR